MYVEIDEAEITVCQSVENDARDQKSGDHEKDIDTDEAAAQQVRECVKDHHRQDRQGTQSVYVRSIRYPFHHRSGVQARTNGRIPTFM